jgi:hypothetical protein
MVTTTQRHCINLIRPSLSPIAVWVSAPRASPAMYTATTLHISSRLSEGQISSYSASESFGWMVHIVYPALMCDCFRNKLVVEKA